MEKTYALTSKQAMGAKLWPIVITVCGLFIIWMHEGSVVMIVLAVLASGASWWFNRNATLSITFRDNGYIQFKFLSKELEISVQDIHKIYEISYYREMVILHSGGKIIIDRRMSDIADFIETVQKHNPAIQVDLKHVSRK